MSHHLGVARRLREAGYRLTPQRLAVLEVVKGNPGHMTLEEVVERLQASHDWVTPSTVYRNLQWLVDVHLVAQTDLGGGSHVYEYIAEKPHHHLVCLRCKRVIDLPDAFLDGLRQAVREQYGYAPCMDHFALFGVCPGCQTTESAKVLNTSF
jgi:Fe2+ or Zn2+ uptake regulation protein